MSRTTIYLHRADLTDRGAFEAYLALFDEFLAAQGRRRSLRIPLAGLLWAACDPRTRGFFGWAQSEGLLPRVNAPGASLVGADLRRAILEGADLRSADLTGAYLAGANLEGAYLAGADLTRADITGACLRSVNLTGAYLTGADITGASLVGADLRGASLEGADLRSAYLAGADLAGAYLTGARRWSNDPPIAGWTLRDGVLVREVAA